MDKSRLVLGTAQLGMTYGVANVHGTPTKENAFGILDAAWDAGINTFDTASAYGTAEKILGEWMHAREVADKSCVVTKIKGGRPDIIRQDIGNSLSILRIKKLDGCMLHAPERMYEAEVLDGVREVKKEGLVSNIGVSVYEPADALHALKLGMDYIQVPYNVFDQRLDHTDFFERAKSMGTTVFARSPFLQGLLLMNAEKLPANLAHAKSYVERFTRIAARHGLSQFNAAFGFAYIRGRADHIVFGVDTKEQLQDIVDAERIAVGNTTYIQELVDEFKEADLSIVDPRTWGKI